MMGEQLSGLARCPHCNVANPNLMRVWGSQGKTVRRDGGLQKWWGAFGCASCGSIVVAKGDHAGAEFIIDEIFPRPKSAHEDVPEPARTFLQQAYDTLHAPDAAAVMAGSAVDAMLKAQGLVDGSVYQRIDQALAKNILTEGMAKWAHTVRLGANRPRHSDEKKPHVMPDEARQSVDFAEALGNFLFVLSARVNRGLKKAGADKGPPA
jgi:hypothetical protein